MKTFSKNPFPCVTFQPLEITLPNKMLDIFRRCQIDGVAISVQNYMRHPHTALQCGCASLPPIQPSGPGGIDSSSLASPPEGAAIQPAAMYRPDVFGRE